MKVLAIVPYHLDFCAGQKFRIELWAKELVKRGIEIDFLPFTNPGLTDVLYKPNRQLKKASLMLGAFARQVAKIFQTNKPDLIFIYREAAIAGPAIIEKIVRRWNVPIVYDIDEPLFVPFQSSVNGKFSKLRFASKIDKLFEMSDSVFAVNRAIAEYAENFNENVHIVPMTVDVDRYQPNDKQKASKKPIIAWVGTWSNQPNIEVAVPAMRELGKTDDFVFRIVADEPMSFEGIEVDFVPWSYAIEVPKLQEAEIGVVPVGESPWGKWKFFFKTVQFMSLGLPVVASAIGSNLEIVEDGENGFLARDEKEWRDKLKLLLDDPNLRRKLGENARKTALEKFDIQKQYNFLETQFRDLANRHQKQNSL
jgi:glycosyltransferase involved in cell wall biosynthesis